MPKKTFSKKLVLNKTTVARLDPPDMDEANGGALQKVSFNIACTMVGVKCPYAWSWNFVTGCIYTDSHMDTCPATATLCGQLYCP